MTETKRELDVNSVIVIVEWNGKKPPTSFYNRIHEYGLYSRVAKPSDDEEDDSRSLLERRASRHGVIMQEGLFIVETRSLATTIAYWAKRYGAEVVKIASMNFQEITGDENFGENDLAVLRGLEDKMSKRGPKPAEDHGNYVVTCYDECRTYETECDSPPVMCKYCASHNIQNRRGNRVVYPEVGSEGTIEKWWKVTRFATGQFEIPETYEPNTNKLPSPVAEITPRVDMPKVVIDDNVKSEMGRAGFYLHLMDVAFCVSKFSDKRRLSNRLDVLSAYAQVDGEKKFYPFSPATDGSIDIMDLCTVDPDTFSRFL